MNYTLKQISEIFNLEFIGDENFSIDQASSFEKATDSSIVFLSEKKYVKLLDKTKSKVIITTKDLSKFCNHNVIISDNPYLLFARISHTLNKKDNFEYGIHSSVVTKTNNLGDKLLIGPNVVLGKNINLGDNTHVGPNSYIGDNVNIGVGVYLYPNVTIYKNVNIGKNVIIHSGTVIGSDGFGYVDDSGKWVKIPHIGGVQIGDNVEIGANTSIDRGTLNDTVIGNGVKIDNQIQIAHNVHIGDNTAIAAGVGIAGSAKIGKNCTIGGMAGIQDHVAICDNTKITGMTKVSRNIKEAGVYSSGTPLMLNKEWLKNAVRFKQLNELFLKHKK